MWWRTLHCPCLCDITDLYAGMWVYTLYQRTRYLRRDTDIYSIWCLIYFEPLRQVLVLDQAVVSTTGHCSLYRGSTQMGFEQCCRVYIGPTLYYLPHIVGASMVDASPVYNLLPHWFRPQVFDIAINRLQWIWAQWFRYRRLALLQLHTAFWYTFLKFVWYCMNF